MPDSPGAATPPDPARGVLLGDLAHDLSTPLTAIHGAIELLLAGTYGPIDGEQRALVLEVLASARELRSYVQDVADLGALDTGRLAFASAPVNVAALVSELRTTMTEAANKRAVSFTVDTRLGGSTVLSDDRRLRQVLTALFGYAVKASRRGSEITAQVSTRDGRLHAEVRSTGITASDPGLLFASRRDATPGVPKPYRGPGLGLPLIGRVVDAWGGRARAEAADGALVLSVEVPVAE
jgi:signal transduction histidine kinase